MNTANRVPQPHLRLRPDPNPAQDFPLAFKQQPGCWCRIPAPSRTRGDWLAEHPEERGQPFLSFARMSMRAVPHAHVRVIELVPLGPFPASVGSASTAWDCPDLGALVRYVAAFFGCDCRLGPPLAIAAAGDQVRHFPARFPPFDRFELDLRGHKQP